MINRSDGTGVASPMCISSEFACIEIVFLILSRNNKASIVTLIVDYDAGNLASVKRACEQVGLAAEFCADPDRLRNAQRVIFPGVGAAGSAMISVKARGLDEALREVISNGCPVLGICLGMQISLDYSEENDTPTLGLIAGKVSRFRMDRPDLKVPHMGWNEVSVKQPHPVLAGHRSRGRVLFCAWLFPHTQRQFRGVGHHRLRRPLCQRHW